MTAAHSYQSQMKTSQPDKITLASVAPAVVDKSSVVKTVSLRSTCAICLNEKEERSMYKTTCGHHFDPMCLGSWAVDKSKCPMCRADLDLTELLIKMDEYIPTVRVLLRFMEIDMKSKTININLNNDLMVSQIMRFIRPVLIEPSSVDTVSSVPIKDWRRTNKRASINLGLYRVRFNFESKYLYSFSLNRFLVDPDDKILDNLDRIEVRLAEIAKTQIYQFRFDQFDEYMRLYNNKTSICEGLGEKVCDVETGTGIFYFDVSIQECIDGPAKRCFMDRTVIKAQLTPTSRTELASFYLLGMTQFLIQEVLEMAA